MKALETLKILAFMCDMVLNAFSQCRFTLPHLMKKTQQNLECIYDQKPKTLYVILIFAVLAMQT